MKKCALQGDGALQFSQNSKMSKTVLMKNLLNNLDDLYHLNSREVHLIDLRTFLARILYLFSPNSKNLS